EAFRLPDGGLEETLSFRVPLLLEGLASGGHLFLPASLLFYKQLQQNVVAIDRKDRTYITRMEAREAVLEFLSKVRDSERAQVSSCSSGCAGGVLPGEFLKRF